MQDFGREPLKSYVDSHWNESVREYISARVISKKTFNLRWVVRGMTPVLQQLCDIAVYFDRPIWMWGESTVVDEKPIWIDVPFEDENKEGE